MTMNRLPLSIFSYYNGNLMLASIISLLLLLLFLLLLHFYAKWFLLQARRHRVRRRAGSLSGLLQGFHRFQTFSSFHAAAATTCLKKGLDPSLIASIPIFLYNRNPAGLRDDIDYCIRQDLGLECVICLSDFEEDDIGRALAKCGHAFHVECIDEWLHSHTTCPICRAPAVSVHEGLLGTNNDDAAMIDVEDNNNTDREEEEGVASVVMDVFVVSVEVGRASSTRRLSEEDAYVE